MTDTGDQSDPDDGGDDGPSNGPDETGVDDADSVSEDELSGASVGTDLDDVVLDELDADGDGESGEASRGLFDDLLSGNRYSRTRKYCDPLTRRTNSPPRGTDQQDGDHPRHRSPGRFAV